MRLRSGGEPDRRFHSRAHAPGDVDLLLRSAQSGSRSHRSMASARAYRWKPNQLRRDPLSPVAERVTVPSTFNPTCNSRYYP